MEFIVAIVAVILVALAWSHQKRKGRKLPPGPYPSPIIGNIFQLNKTNIHQSYAHLSKKYGPLMSIHLGSVLDVVVSSPEMAKQVLTRPECADRPIPEKLYAHDRYKHSIVTLPANSPKWKNMRRICKEHAFANHSLEKSQPLRHKILLRLIDYVQKCCDAGRAVNIHDAASTTTFNFITASLFSAEASDFESTITSELEDIVDSVTKFMLTPNIADLFPILRSLDPQRVRRDADHHFGRLLRYIKTRIDERFESRKANPNHPKLDDLVDTIVDSTTTGSEYNFSLDEIMHLLFDLLTAGSDTTMMSIEWIMAEMLLHPNVLAKATDEVRNVLGDRKIMEEADISRLPYLQAVIKEVLRLHPPIAIFLPRYAKDDMEINGYFIPKNTQLTVNAWAIGRDPSIWPNPDSFEPERFLNNNINYKGQHLEFIPFGSGRRICPAMPLAYRAMNEAVAALIHNFDWKIATRESECNRELLVGIVLQREVPLLAIPMKP